MNLLRSAKILIATGLVCLGLSHSARADIIAYAATDGGDFGTLDLTTGVYSSIGSTGVMSINGMGFINGTLYGLDSSIPRAGIYTIDTTSGAANQIATSPSSAMGATTGFGAIYSVSQDSPSDLFATNPSGGLIGTLPLPFKSDGLIAFDSAFKNLYFSAINTVGGDDLWCLTSHDGLTDVGSLGVDTVAFSGVIVGTTLYSTDGINVYSYAVTPTSVSEIGSVAISGLYDGDLVYALALSPVPEPSSVVLGSIGIVAAGFVVARKRRASN